MTIDTRTAGAWLDLASQHGRAALIAGGLVVGLLLLLARVARHQRRRSAALTFAAAGIALGFSAEGMWEVAVGALHLAKWQAVLLFAFAEVLMLFEADQARKKIADERDPSRHIRAVWVIAAVAALAAASHADNTSGQVVRFFMPMAVAWQWSSRIKDDLPEVARQESSWIWTPRRVGVELGLLKPGAADDLSEVFRRRNVDQMVRLARLVDTGWPKLAGRRDARLRRLAEGATAQMLDEVRERHQRGATVRAHIFAQSAQLDRAPVAQAPAMPAQVALPQVAHLAARVDAPAARRGQVVLRRPAEPPAEPTADEREAALLRAVARVRAGEKQREAARAEDVPESTLRTRLKQTNGHSFELAGK